MSLQYVKIGLLVSLVALLADIMAIALPWWSYREEEKFGELWKTNAGLWEECVRLTDILGDTKYNCFKIQEPSETINLARNTCLFGMLLILGGMLITCTGRWILVELQLVPLVGALTTSFAGFLIWLGVLLYSDDYVKTAGNEPWEVHAGWWIGLAASFLCYITSILYLWDKRKEGEVDQPEPEQSRTDQNQRSSSSYYRKDSWASGYSVGPQRRLSSRGSQDRQSSDNPIQSISRLEVKTSRYY